MVRIRPKFNIPQWIYLERQGRKGRNGKFRTIVERTSYKSWMISEEMKFHWRRENFGRIQE